MSYTVELTERAIKGLHALPDAAFRRVSAALTTLADRPRPAGLVAIKGRPSDYRIRVGTYRIGYEVDDKARVVTVWEIGDRKRFYQQAKRRQK